MLNNRLLRTFIVIVAIGVVGGLFLRMVSLTVGLRDTVRVSTNFHQSGLYISDILPLPLAGEAEKIHGEWQTVLLGWPAFLDVKPMAAFDAVDATLRYRAAPEVRGLRWGAMIDRETNAFSTGYAARVLAELGWRSVATGDVAVYSDDRQTGSTRALGVGVPVLSKIRDYVARDTMQSLHVNLRGEHRFLVYAENERIRFSFAMQDMNRTEGADDVFVRVSNAANAKDVVYSVVHKDDGNVIADQKQTGLFTVSVVTDVLPLGLYQIEVLTNDDVFIRDFSTTQQKFVLRERASLGDVVGYSQENPATTMLVYGSVLDARLEHPRALQTLRVGDEELSLGVPFVVESMLLNDDAITSVRSPKNDVALVTDGLIGFSQATMFTPILPMISFAVTADELRARGVSKLVVARDTVSMSDEGEIVLRDLVAENLDRTHEGSYRFSIEPIMPSDVPLAGTFLLSEVGFSLRRPVTSLLYTVTHLRELLDRGVGDVEYPIFAHPPKIYGRID